MMKTKNLKPKGDVRVRKPDGTYLAAEGESLLLSAYWLRRIAEGDVDVSDITIPQTEVDVAVSNVVPPKTEATPVETAAPKSTKTEK
ncbi:TPA: DUF2635 domain-containing protein [Serratia marcescens]|uniref:DUF2635 domain-containing protein n=1 Tax=Serratia TaxID=613 RepID=UPI001F2276A7|nr:MULTISPECIES: DUF2635 domain-containing protein [Serratia]MCE9941440.1 DUF2635 domain-containing protein [Serratia liquefaciens]